MGTLKTNRRDAVLQRVRYFPRQLITADDMRAEQEYFRQKLRMHNRFLHGWGVVCGLEVTPAATRDQPWLVSIGPGYALSPQGDEIYVPNSVELDLAKKRTVEGNDCNLPSHRPAYAPIPTGEVYVAIRYAECEARPMRVHPVGCDCDDSICEYSRIIDSFEIESLSDLPASHSPLPEPEPIKLFQQTDPLPCKPEISDPWLVLASVKLPDDRGVNIPESAIDDRQFRKILLSTTTIWDQVILLLKAMSQLSRFLRRPRRPND